MRGTVLIAYVGGALGLPGLGFFFIRRWWSGSVALVLGVAAIALAGSPFARRVWPGLPDPADDPWVSVVGIVAYLAVWAWAVSAATADASDR